MRALALLAGVPWLLGGVAPPATVSPDVPSVEEMAREGVCGNLSERPDVKADVEGFREPVRAAQRLK